MRVLLALLLAFPATCLAQAFQPDANYNGVIDANDLLSFLPLFGGDFTPTTSASGGVLFINVDDFFIDPENNPQLSWSTIESNYAIYLFEVYLEEGPEPGQGGEVMSVSLTYNIGECSTDADLTLNFPVLSYQYDLVHIVGNYSEDTDSISSFDIVCNLIDEDYPPPPYSELRIITETTLKPVWNFEIADQHKNVLDIPAWPNWMHIIYSPVPVMHEWLGPVNWRLAPGW